MTRTVLVDVPPGISLVMPVPPVGCYVLGTNFRIFINKRPRWLTRYLMRVLLEWQWEDAK